MDFIEKMSLKQVPIFAVVFPFMLVLISPLTFYLGNYQEYALKLADILHFLLPAFGILSAFLLILLLAAYHFSLLYKLVSGLLVGLALCVWVESQLFLWNFGLFDGTSIDWTLWSAKAKIDWGIWALILLLTLYLALKRPKKLVIMAQAVMLLGFLSFLSTFFTYYHEHTNSSKPQESLLSFHKENNKILIVLDTFQSDAFNEIVQKWPDEVDFLRGFSFYPNTVGGYPTTKASIPLILTGKLYKNEISFSDWLVKNYQSRNIADYHSSLGYGVSLASFAPQVLNGINAQKAYFSNFSETSWLGFQKHQLLALDTGLFKAFPIAWKPCIYNNGYWLLAPLAYVNNELSPTMNAEDMQFLKYIEKNSKADSTAKGEFKFYHYVGVHGPDNVNESFKVDTAMPANRESYVRHARGVLNFLKRKFALLNRLGVYDSAEIIVIGDHGGHSIMPDDLQSELIADNKINPAILGSARPLFLYKPSKADMNAQLKYSDDPKYLADIVCILSQDSPEFGCDKNQRDQVMRPRQFYFYNWSSQFWDKDYLPPMESYLVEGDVRNLASWRQQELKYYGAGRVKKLQKIASYTLGQTINFGDAESVQKYLWGGWGGQEAQHRWTVGNQSRLIMNLEQNPTKPLVLRLQGSPLLSVNQNEQEIKVLANNQEVALWKINDLGWYEAKLNPELVKDGMLDIRFLVSKPIAPCDTNMSQDCRKLGLLIKEIVIDKQKKIEVTAADNH